MIIVCGCPRSGTSLMMTVLGTVFGWERLLGEKFPMEERWKKIQKKHPKETDRDYELRMYVQTKLAPDKEKELVEAKDMNPNGFWECPYSVAGISWSMRQADQLRELETDRGKICKIVSQGLAQSDPRYIDKIVFMLRDPHSVAKSQERLKRSMPFVTEDGEEHDVYENMKIHSPQMFINVTIAAARWLNKHREVPILYVKYDDLVERPMEVLPKLQAFLGEGDFSKAASLIDVKLRRSKAESVASDLWVDADTIYEMMCAGKLEEILKYAEDETRPFHRQQNSWLCLRTMLQTGEGHCKACLADANFRNQLKKQAEARKLAWQNEPCVFECQEKQMPVKESITNNHWK
ncbi:MAG: sulfotransferase domain-containing protein [Candidatus Nanopelagicaceae bacterium]|nr:sulfotransferase domain-containing protein [Candidatus Nanopelagicaceae bacterium]